MPRKGLPELNDCCGCVTDLRTAAAIIAVLGIVSSPSVSWAVVRHSYAIHVSCYITSSLSRPDVVDITFNNILSFGFGANPGIGPSCFNKKSTTTTTSNPNGLRQNTVVFRAKEKTSSLVSAVRYVGWVVLVIDLIFLFCSIFLLIKIFNGPDDIAAKVFMGVALFALLMSFVYNMLYVAACVTIGGSFPVAEFLYAFIDIFKWTIWIHFLLVIYSYTQCRKSVEETSDGTPNDQSWWITKWLRSVIGTPLRRWRNVTNV